MCHSVKTFAVIFRMLFSVGYGTGLSDHSDLDLSRISHLLLDLLGDVSGESSGLVIADLLGANNDAELTAGWMA